MRVFRNPSGLSLIEIVMGMGALGGVMLSVVALNEIQNKNLKSGRLASTRDNLRNLLERYVQDRGILEKSATYRGTNDAGNVALDYCLNGPPAGATPTCPLTLPRNCCAATTSTAPQPFILLDPTDATGAAKLSGTETAVAPLAATTATPVYYDADGMVCAASSANCPIEVTTSYVADCGGAPSCERASKLYLRYSIRKTTGVDKAGLFKEVTRTVPMGGYGVGSGAVAGTTGPTGGSGGGTGGVAPSLFEMRGYSLSVIPACPPPWTEIGSTSVRYGNDTDAIRYCQNTTQQCAVQNLYTGYSEEQKENTKVPVVCPGGWNEIASYTTRTGFYDGNTKNVTYYARVRVCAKCQ